MQRQRINQAIREAIQNRKVVELSDEDLGLEVIERIARDSENLDLLAEAALRADEQPALRSAVKDALGKTTLELAELATLKGIAKKRKFRTMDRNAFRKWLLAKIGEEVRKLICDSLYGMIDTPEERKAILDKYDDVIVDAIVSAYPPLALARPLIKPVVRYLLAKGLAAAANNLDEYCAVAP